MGGGPTPESKTTQTQSNEKSSATSGPPEAIEYYLKQIIGSGDPGAGGIASWINKAPPSLFPGSYTAAPSDTTNAAISGYANYQNPFSGANTALTNATLQGDRLHRQGRRGGV
jgi:hypothetical protein